LTIHEIAARLNKRCLVLPAGLLRAALWLLKRLGLTQYGPEQLDFLRYRPVLDNRRLKEEFGYVPRLSSAEVFDLWRTAQQKAP
jgi:UDP-glucose 4-epimerase